MSNELKADHRDYVRNIARAAGFISHETQTFKLSRDAFIGIGALLLTAMAPFAVSAARVSTAAHHSRDIVSASEPVAAQVNMEQNAAMTPDKDNVLKMERPKLSRGPFDPKAKP